MREEPRTGSIGGRRTVSTGRICRKTTWADFGRFCRCRVLSGGSAVSAAAIRAVDRDGPAFRDRVLQHLPAISLEVRRENLGVQYLS